MAYIRRIVVVCGYGCHLTPELTAYLDEVAAHIRKTESYFVILCGGFTQRASAPGKSEAAVMAEYLRPLVGERAIFYLEEDSYMTQESIRGSAAIIRTMRQWPWRGAEPRVDEVTVFCEAQRALKVLLCCWFLMPVRVKLKTASWELASPVWELVKTAKDMVTLFVPPVAAYLRRKVIAKSETR